jgi:WD40 repeat protein
VAFSVDDKLLATTNRGGLTTLWDIEQRKTVGRFQGPGARAYVPAFSPDGRLMSVVYSDGKGMLFGLDAESADFISTEAAKLENLWGGVVAIRFSPTGRRLVIRYASGRLAVWNTGRWLPEHRLPMQAGRWYRKRSDPDRLADISVATDGSVIGIETAGKWRGWSTESGSEVEQKVGTMLPLSQASPSEIGERSLRIAGQQADLHDRAIGRTLRLPHNDDVISAVFSPNGRCVVTTSGVVRASGGPPEDGYMARLWDTETGVLLREWEFTVPPVAAFFASVRRVVVLYENQALVYRVPLCESGTALIESARARVATDAALGGPLATNPSTGTIDAGRSGHQ